MPLYTASAIVLRRTNFGETDRIVTLYTREYGKVGAIAKGARKPISRLAGATEVLTYAKFQLAGGRSLHIISQIEVKDSFPRIRADLYRSAYAMYIAEVVEKMQEELDPNPEVFDLLLSTLYLIERPNDPEKIARMFDLQFMKILGYEPILNRCLRCSAPLPAEEIYFSPSMGGTVCRSCGYLPDDAIPISRAAVETMRALLTAEARAIERMEIPQELLDQIARVMRWYIRYRAEREFKSLDFIQSLKLQGTDKT